MTSCIASPFSAFHSYQRSAKPGSSIPHKSRCLGCHSRMLHEDTSVYPLVLGPRAARSRSPELTMRPINSFSCSLIFFRSAP